MTASAASDQQIVGRTAELDVLRRLVDGAVDGHAQHLLIFGDAGVGKTALVRDVCARHGGRVDVLWASCLPLSSLTVPFLPFTTALHEWATAHDRATPDNLGPAEFDAWLDEACDRRPVLMVVDDLQWADQSSLDVLMYVVAGPARRRLGVAATVRAGMGGGPGESLRRWLSDVRRLPRVEELAVGVLDRPTTGQQLAGLLGEPPHQALIDAVYGRTQGNAYLTTLLARTLSPGATAVPAGLPRDLREAVSRAWYSLSTPARTVTVLLAVAGRPQRAAQLDAVAPAEVSGRAVSLLREAVDAQVIEVLGTGRYWFVHPLLAEVLEEQLLPEEGQAWHAAFAAALEPVADRDVEVVIDVAEHHHRAGHVEDAYRWALRGAEVADRIGGAAESTRLLRRALDGRGHVSDPGLTEVDLLQRMRRAAENAGLHEYELAAVDDLLTRTDVEKQPLLAAELLVRRMHLRFLTGDEFFEVAGMHRAVQLAGTDPRSPQYALAVAELADAELWHGLPTGAERARTAVRLARACAADRPLTYALVADVMAQVMRPEAGDLDELPEGVVQADEARAAAGRGRDFFGLVHATLWAGNCLDYFTSATVHERLSRGRDELAAFGAPHPYIAWLNTCAAAGLLLSGDWQGCEQLLRVALGSTPGRFADTDARLTAALLACWQGRLSEARAHLGRAEELFAEQSGFLVLIFDMVRATLAVAAGDTGTAVAAARAGLSQDIPPTLVQWLLPLAARALADDAQRRRDRQADPGPAMAELNDLRQRYPHVVVDPGPGRQARQIRRAMQSLYDAETARCRQHPDAGDAWQHAATACHTAGLPWDEAYAQWRTAQTLLPHRADRARATAALRRAVALATDLNATPLLADITALASSARIALATTPVSLSTDPTPYRLTPRELEILGHVLAGRTYSEMARALVVSEKTVSAHISNMLRKTGAANRVELSQLAHRLIRAASPRP